ncbi:MAG TPA: nicotinate (nicotinamide) nucleotide adenylyltransferase [Bacteroidales bacterium]|nr:nicotinate (nicotinamide) nucleotide adenylyltransferase [Bacteroidales bacterium]HQI70165.1 nicotinate (nicotinamide) nucleotide adenylyltransferase [Bacteroidales bacterium]
MNTTEKNVGLYFGSFNPIHKGHLSIARHLLKSEALHEVWFVISPQSPFKSVASLLDDDCRYEMVLLAIKNNKGLRACNIEFGLSQPSYTINTLEELKEKYPGVNFCVIMGSDNLDAFDKWKSYEDILSHYRIMVYPRGGSDGGRFRTHPSVRWIDAPLLDISSTAIREAIRQGQDVKGWLPAKVLAYINKKGFYK